MLTFLTVAQFRLAFWIWINSFYDSWWGGQIWCKGQLQVWIAPFIFCINKSGSKSWTTYSKQHNEWHTASRESEGILRLFRFNEYNLRFWSSIPVFFSIQTHLNTTEQEYNPVPKNIFPSTKVLPSDMISIICGRTFLKGFCFAASLYNID